MKVYVTFDPKANRAGEIVNVNNHDRLTPRAAIAARNLVAGVAASCTVTDYQKWYRVVGNRARKIKPPHEG